MAAKQTKASALLIKSAVVLYNLKIFERDILKLSYHKELVEVKCRVVMQESVRFEERLGVKTMVTKCLQI